MNNLVKIALIVLIASVIGGYVGGLVGNQSDNLGAGTRFPSGVSADTTSPVSGQVRATTLLSTGATTIGSSGTAVSRLNTGTCYIRPYASTIAASSTATVDCQGTATWDADGMSTLAGVTFGDFVQITLSTTTSGETVNALQLVGASASTTAGFIQLRIANLIGDTFTWPVLGSASGTASYLITN